MWIQSRRNFLQLGMKAASALGAAGAMGKFGAMNALAYGPDYKALVCIFLYGGNDGHNTVVPITMTGQSYANYASARGAVALPQASLLPFGTSKNETFGLHPKLAEIHNLYQLKKAAVLANTGMLVTPIANRQVYLNGQVPVPANLFSHSDQQDQWQTATPNNLAATGWGGRMSDLMQGMNAGSSFPSTVFTASNGIFCTGQQTFPTTVPPGGAIALGGLSNNPARLQGVQQLLTFDNGLKLVQASNKLVSGGVANANLLNGALTTAPNIQTQFPANNQLAAQLKMVARIISVRAQLGLSRQIFFCSLGGFDTHSGQVAQQDVLLQQLSQAVGAFYTSTVELGIDSSVTTFTSSEFGRTLMPNSSGGTDHAWGSHHFAIGGAVKGGDMVGAFPQLALGGQQDATGRGSLIPSISVDQYGATLANWFGVSQPNLPTLFPNIGNFAAAANLGFLG